MKSKAIGFALVMMLAAVPAFAGAAKVVDFRGNYEDFLAGAEMAAA